ncbi:hypothetical protein OCK74_02695 [Chitinophagaceae bacterium LB-8]|uniref:Beta-carotene 15,15'-monooxygenase n=1 Tax=Paraflavisolibacter caeni TaxID=2982496 RepID=A0A9X3B715_9BACT|nr:hypothetical protein [Paraflavisolibacter caeni]MCU7548001.1 hypothetical protein [Paraflavisolibacter caeni]
MIALFKQKSPANVAVLFIFGLLIKIPLFLYSVPLQATATDGGLYPYFSSLLGLTESNSSASAFVAFLILYVQALMLNHYVNEYRMTTHQTFLPAMAYLLVTSLLPEWSYLSPQLVAATLIIWAFGKLFRLYNQQAAKGIVYNIGLIVGFSSFIFFPSAAFLLTLCLGMAILKPFRFNELVLMLIGALTPYYFYAVYLFLVDQLTPDRIIPNVTIGLPDMRMSASIIIVAILLFVPFFVGAAYIRGHLRRMLIQVRKNWTLLVLYLITAMAIPFINADNRLHNWLFMTAPFAAFHSSAYLYPKKRWISLGIFFATVAFILVMQFVKLGWKV